MTTNHIADRQEPSEVAQPKVHRLQDKIATLRQQMQKLKEFEVRMLEAPDQIAGLTSIPLVGPSKS